MEFVSLRFEKQNGIHMKILLLSIILALSACSTLGRDCCKTCSTGKACGDTCISKSYTCHEGAGCACDD